MQYLFDIFVYNDDFYEKVQAGIAPEECDYEKDCVREKILIDPSQAKAARPGTDGRYTEVCVSEDRFLVIDISFKDYLQLVPHQYAKVAKQRWAN